MGQYFVSVWPVSLLKCYEKDSLLLSCKQGIFSPESGWEQHGHNVLILQLISTLKHHFYIYLRQEKDNAVT